MPKLIVQVGLSIVLALTLEQTAVGDESPNAKTRIDSLVENELLPGQIKTACGVTRQETPIVAILDPAALKLRPQESGKFKNRILLIGGLDRKSASSQAVLKTWRNFYRDDQFAELRKRFALAAVPFAFPDGDARQDAKETTPVFPPKAKAYGDLKHPEAIYLWRWIGNLAPDAIVVLHANGSTAWTSNGSLDLPTKKSDEGSFAHAISNESPLKLGSMLTVEVGLNHAGDNWASELLQAIAKLDRSLIDSKAHQELARRAARSPLQVTQQLTKVYGHDLSSVAYIPSLALLGRLRVGELDGDKQHAIDVARIVAPYVDGRKQPLGKRVSGSTLSGHLIFSELARRTKETRYTKLAQAAADLGFEPDGKMKISMPYHNEMSDAVFMGTPILVQTGRLTGESKYYDMANRHLRFMAKLNRRSDGLHQHSPVDKRQTAWGRGNGFVALGLALSLSDLPKDSAHRPYMLKAFQEHIAAMAKHQDEMGMWHQVVDHPESYREFTVTCMTTFSIARGIRRGWLPRAKYEPVIKNAWHGIARRIGTDGVLIDVCTGTGRQRSFRDYLDRPAIFGKDARGGAMALMVTTELAHYFNR
jgi:unsaturated rhamnogalacturonyl hydrolase